MKIANIFKNIVIVVLVLSFLFVAVMTVFGFKGYSVVTDSMAPTIKRGYAVFVKEITFDELQSGDIVTVRLSQGGTFTHRVVEIDRENEVFYTKGDNSSTVDGASEAKDIVGKVVFYLPYAGYFSIAFSNRIVLAITLAALVVMFTALRILTKIIAKKKEVTENE